MYCVFCGAMLRYVVLRCLCCAILCCVALHVCIAAVLSVRAGSRPKQPATGQSLAGYFRLTLLLIFVTNLK